MTEKQFFELLRSGLWDRPADASLFAEIQTDWETIYQIAKKQTVTAIVLDGIMTLPASLRPQREDMRRWIIRSIKIEQANEKMNSMAAELFPIYRSAGLTPILLKGQGMASLYPHPDHRQCGDIDIYFGTEGFDTANSVLKELGGVGESFTDKHAGFEYKDIHIENHRITETLNNPWSDGRFQHFMKTRIGSNTKEVNINGCDVTIPNPAFNAVYIFIHAFSHMLYGGVGLRQVCDWAKLCVVGQSEIDGIEVEGLLKDLKLLKAASAFAYVAVNYLGMPASSLPFNALEVPKQGEIMLNNIMYNGNFGKYHPGTKLRPKSYLPGKLQSFTLRLRNLNELNSLAPSEARWCVWTVIKMGVPAIFKDKMVKS